MKTSILTKQQEIVKSVSGFRLQGGAGSMKIKIRYDDCCNNGHNTFVITGVIYRDDKEWGWGTIHDDITQYAPEFIPLLKWHGMTSKGPLYYLEDTLFHASDRDCHGLQKGEKRQIINGQTQLPCWVLAIDIEGTLHQVSVTDLKCRVDALEADLPTPPTGLVWMPWYRIGEGKQPDLEAARCSAIWPEASLEQLQDKQQLEARLPALIEEFAQVIESLGMTF